MRKRHLVPLMLLALVAVGLPHPSHAEQQAARPRLVTLVVDYGLGVEKRWSRVAYTDRMTALEVLKSVSEMNPPWGLELELSGEGPSAQVLAIDGVRNEHADKGGFRWFYSAVGVDDLMARSPGTAVLRPDTEVRWWFGRAMRDD